MDAICYILNVLSDIFLVISSVVLIDAFGVSTVTKSTKYLWVIICSIFCSSIMFFLYRYDFKAVPILLYPLMFVTAYIIAFKKVNIVQIYIALFIELFTSLISSSFTFVFLRQLSMHYYISNSISLLFIRTIIFCVIIIFKFKKNAKNLLIILKSVPKHIFVLIALSLVFIDFISSFNNYPDNITSKHDFIALFVALLTVTLVVMIFSLLINVASKNYYTALNSLLEKQVEAQITHYEKLEELNRDIRQLRHDYINHLTSIGTLIKNGDYPDALQYIERLTESTHCNETIFSTGNHLADAILTGKSNECKEFANIEFNGIITDRINNTDMCAILANTLDNAIEACRKCSGRSKISIAAQNKQGYWVMTMRNPTISEDSEGLMKTSKEDTQNHGFGLLSIEQAVKRYDGNIKVGIKDGIFEISIVVKA